MGSPILATADDILEKDSNLCARFRERRYSTGKKVSEFIVVIVPFSLTSREVFHAQICGALMWFQTWLDGFLTPASLVNSRSRCRKAIAHYIWLTLPHQLLPSQSLHACATTAGVVLQTTPSVAVGNAVLKAPHFSSFNLKVIALLRLIPRTPLLNTSMVYQHCFEMNHHSSHWNTRETNGSILEASLQQLRGNRSTYDKSARN